MHKSIIGTALLLIAGATASYADTISLVGPFTTKTYQQGTNSPCVIGNASCQNPSGFSYTLIPSNPSGGHYVNVASPTYTVSQIESIAGSSSFWVGIDINQTNVPQLLSYFGMWVNGAEVDKFSTEGTPVPAGNNGNGYADYLLETFKLAGFDADDHVQFIMDMPLANDGAEQFFLIGAPADPPPAVPEPSTIALLGTGLLSAAGVLSRRKAVR